MSPLRFPLVDPSPPRLSEHPDVLARVERSGMFSNNGPELQAFEAEVAERLFGGRGACLGVGNATLGLVVAIRQAAGRDPAPGTLALMPAMTFAATAQAALWAGLTPLICDVDRDDWGACAAAEERLLERHAGKVGVLVPYATFGAAIDVDRYAWLMRRHGVGVVIDAAASLGTIDAQGAGFGAGAPFAVVFSLHATKTFAVAEGGLIHSGDAGIIDELRAMINFGFRGSRSAVLPGINAKMPELIAAMARLKLAEINTIAVARAQVAIAYRAALAGFTFQASDARRQAMQFQPVLLPPELAARRDAVIAALAADGIGAGCYFSPHIGQQPWLRDHSLVTATPVTDDVARRIVSLPISDRMSAADARFIAERLRAACAAQPRTAGTAATMTTLIVGGGPAGCALLTAASKQGRLADLAQAGLTIVERDDAIGNGRLAGYAINSDSTAETFLTAVRDNPCPEIAALARHPAAQEVGRHIGRLGVPLAATGQFLGVIGDRLAGIVAANGGELATGHEAIDAHQLPGGGWQTRLRRLGDGAIVERRSHTLVIATGGAQPFDRLAGQQVAGASLLDLANGRLVQSDEVLALGGLDRIADLLADARAPRVVVVGGSTSALAAVALLLRSRPGIPFGAGDLTLLHRRPLLPFYPSAEAARADGFIAFGEDDVCPVSGFVYRLAGFRLEARELVLRMLRIDGRAPDPRVTVMRIGDDEAAARGRLAEADLVIAALGYRPRALPLFDRSGRPIALAAQAGKPMVDGHCRVLGADGQPVPGVYGIGLAAGFVPSGRLGGEKSFTGQANGLWLWQNDVGQMIVDQVLGTAQRAVA